jgi:mono/diheme cytochrome c family protein
MGAGLLALATLLLTLAACGPKAPATPFVSTIAADQTDPVARGRYLATAADCVACHTAPGGRAFAGGRAFKLPFGTMYSTNITPDGATGIGGYTDDQFVRALHQGVRRDGKHLYPSMPYTSFTAMTRVDALAIKVYLLSLPPVAAPARKSNFPFPFNQRWGMAFWDAAFLTDRRFIVDPALSAEQARGAYLATALGHCGECHTPRNLAFGLKASCPLCGADLQGWRAFNITADRTAGVGAWRREDLVAYLVTGHAAQHGAASGPMAEAVENSLQHLTPQDAQALAAYLLTVQARPGKPARPADPPSTLQASTLWAPATQVAGLGQRVFEGSCASCHAWNGTGTPNDFAALAGSRAVSDPDGLNVVQVILAGADGHIAGQAVKMPGFGHGLSDAEIAAVSNYVLRQFGGVQGAVTQRKVAAARTQS